MVNLKKLYELDLKNCPLKGLYLYFDYILKLIFLKIFNL